ncbi:MAG: hypothetical protein M1814_005417 [Vezdaea aestivalis]|nr:MAG: hypothetical protein M1814_005417 [Vezdaea aestivalis]
MNMGPPGYNQAGGLQQHQGGMAGHPMPPGHPNNPGQPRPGPQPGQGMPQGMHPGVSGPGVQVTQGGPGMPGMPPGAGGGPGVTGGPSNHAMQHLTPASQQQQQHMVQQAQQQQQLHQAALLATNPQYLQHQQIMRQKAAQQQHQAAMLAQQAHGMPITIPNSGLNPMHLAALQNQRISLPPHLQHQQQNAQAQAQAAHHQQQLMAQQIANHPMNQANAANMQESRPPQNHPNAANAQQQIQNAQVVNAAAAQQHAQQQHNPLMGRSLRGNYILNLISFGNSLSQASNAGPNSSLEFFTNLVHKFFSHTGTLRHQLWHAVSKSTKDFEVTFPHLPRYWYNHFQSGVVNIQLTLQNAQESEQQDDCHIVAVRKAIFIYGFENGSQLVASGTLTVKFDIENKIDLMMVNTAEHKEYLPRLALEQQLLPKEEDQKMSPKQTKNLKQRQQKQAQSPQLTLPESPVTAFGVTGQVFNFLEFTETMNLMVPLALYSQANTHLSPSGALRQYVASIPQSGGQFPMGMVGQAAGMRNAGMMPNAGGAQFASPAGSHLNLPGSPHVNIVGQQHTPSPAQHHIQAPGLVAQHSQQGNSSSQGTSANTSPSNNKRRRPSAVKAEVDDSGGVQVNGTATGKVKASPKVGANKRQKTNPAQA